MSTYEALRVFGLDYYATALDIKAAYRRLAMALRPSPAMDDPESVRAAEAQLQRLNRAYAALHNRVDHTPPGIDPLPGVEAAAKPAVRATGLQALGARLRARETWQRGVERCLRFALPRVESPRFGSPRVVRAAAVVVAMATVGYGIVRGAAEIRFSPTVVDAKTVSAPRVEPRLPAPAAYMAAAEKVPPVPEKTSPLLTAARSLRAVLPGVDPVEAKAIGSACLAETGAEADAFQACVLRTARETPHAIHLD